MTSRLLAVLLFVLPAFAQRQPARVAPAPNGAARITFANGTSVSVAKEPGQVTIREGRIAMNGTVGWLVKYNAAGSSFAGTLILWGAGQTIRKFPTAQSFYSWAFYADGKQVAFHTGPLHGEQKSHCELHDVASGRLIAEWEGDLDSTSNRPAWTTGLIH